MGVPQCMMHDGHARQKMPRVLLSSAWSRCSPAAILSEGAQKSFESVHVVAVAKGVAVARPDRQQPNHRCGRKPQECHRSSRWTAELR